MFHKLTLATLVFLSFCQLGCYPERETPNISQSEEEETTETNADAGTTFDHTTPDSGHPPPEPQTDAGSSPEPVIPTPDAGTHDQHPAEFLDSGPHTEPPSNTPDAGSFDIPNNPSDAGSPPAPCDDNPCGNNATCQNNGTDFQCTCDESTYEQGEDCIPLTDCAPGDFVATAATDTSDRICQTCAGYPETQLSEDMVENGNVNFNNIRIDPASERVAYHADGTIDNFQNIYSVVLQGGTANVVDNRTSPDSFYLLQGDYQWTPDGQYLIFQDLQPNVNTHRLLFRSTATEAPGVVQLGPNAPSSVTFRINSTSSRVLYNNENGQLYSAPISGAGATLLASDLASNSIDDFLISLDGQKTVYRTKANNITRLYSIDVQGESVPVELTAMDVTIIISQIDDFTISPDGNFVVFTYKQNSNTWDELYSVPITGGTPKRLNGNFSGAPNLPSISFKVSANSQKVFYLADENNSGVRDLFVAPIDESNAALQISDTNVVGGEIFNDFQPNADGSLVTYRGRVSFDGDTNLFTSGTSFMGSMPMIAPLCEGCNVLDFHLHLDTAQVAYRLSDAEDTRKLYLVNNGSANGDPMMPDMPHPTEVFEDYQFSSEGDILFYSAQQEVSTRRDLYAHFLSRGTYRRINEPFAENHLIWNWEISPDAKHIVYIIGPADAENTKHIYSAFVEGGTHTTSTNAEACTPWTICAADESIDQPGSTSADQTCDACPVGQEPGHTNADACLSDTGENDNNDSAE
ncbi:MAG: hypothetical protein CMH56_10485 [Myxococcales bacterium]|nr:hypothetical protein [Myxococcales bacterium]